MDNNFREIFISETGQQYYDWHGFKLEYVEWLEKRLNKADRGLSLTANSLLKPL
jgi:hypothetical protein